MSEGGGAMVRLGSKRWRGVLAGGQAAVRRALSINLAALAVAMPFGPLGYCPIGGTHVLLSIIPVALAALLFGSWRGCAIGAIAGLAEFVRATYQPFDYYEKYFSLPFNSIVLFALFGLGLGVLFSAACRLPSASDLPESQPRLRGFARIGALVAACAAGSVLFTVLMQVGIDWGNASTVLAIPSSLSSQAFSVQGAVEQVCWHVLFTALPCIAMDAAVRRYGSSARKLSMRAMFHLWFGALMVAFFFVASAAAHVAITHLSVENMNAALSDQADLLAVDLAQRDGIVGTLDERGVLPREELREFAGRQYSQIDCDLAGWSQDVTVLAQDGIVFASNDEGLVGSKLADITTPALQDATLADAFSSEVAVECYQGQGYEISYLYATEMGYDRLGSAGSYQLAIVVPGSEVFLDRPLYLYLVAAVFTLLFGTVFLMLMSLLKRMVVQPVDAANRVLGRITAGELDQRVPDGGSAEFSSLAKGINTTVSALEDSIAEANARIDRELAAARTIQQSALPAAQPPFPAIDSFDLYATMDPARQVGGDFYDYFDLGERGIGFVVADVSGKGMSAALFMMASKTAIRGAMEAKADLAQAIGIANRSLCKGNDAEMFVTVFAGVLDYRTGKLTYVNAGHNKPLVMRGGTWSWLKERSGPYLGSFDWVDYRQFEMQLAPGDELFAYTDGVNEAFNVHEECYGNERLEAFLASHCELHPRRLFSAMRAELIGWAHGAEQSDDITMLALKFGISPESGASMLTTASLENFEEVRGFVERLLQEAGCPGKESRQVLIALEELVVNVCSYAYPDAAPDAPGPLRIHFTHRSDPSAVVIEIGDDGVPFNPLAREDPELPESIEEAKIGGLGLFMTKNMMDEIEYVREGITNVTIITKRWA